MVEDHLTREERKTFCLAVGTKLRRKCPKCGKNTLYNLPRGIACWNCGYGSTLSKGNH